MKISSVFLWFLGIGIILSGCSTTSALTSDVKSSQVTDLQYFEPISVVYLITDKNHATFSDSISRQSKSMQIKIVNSMKEQVPVADIIYWQDSSANKKIRKEVQFLLDDVWKQQSVDEVKITPLLDSILEKRNKRFGLITLANGFTRTKQNYDAQLRNGVAVAVATMGFYTKLPMKSKSEIFALIVDAKENNVAFYKTSTLIDKDPLDTTVISRQLKGIFKGYFKPKK